MHLSDFTDRCNLLSIAVDRSNILLYNIKYTDV